ncbi:hypothetical protein [Pseudobacteriovorax antillogorgiicola]|uniref:F5/8 type C domain-containing protein n=1 Tax=Pseudobacteriovorax antillogorgiicola TaxID=1513793 RepID=A0A1Y6CBZ7_9BACT|nr:hypothetical protein [Pseudobacteriovorax antillogorgiicola]TCS48359.1 hypothetical protein EDD56_118139 [Pseudobacteriovorax antillogorgiicola]SMF56199.1 hypothetical protein SAMN06296036_1182 [Pseudobacteriovorax antillogorgiicola]
MMNKKIGSALFLSGHLLVVSCGDAGISDLSSSTDLNLNSNIDGKIGTIEGCSAQQEKFIRRGAMSAERLMVGLSIVASDPARIDLVHDHFGANATGEEVRSGYEKMIGHTRNFECQSNTEGSCSKVGVQAYVAGGNSADSTVFVCDRALDLDDERAARGLSTLFVHEYSHLNPLNTNDLGFGVASLNNAYSWGNTFTSASKEYLPKKYHPFKYEDAPSYRYYKLDLTDAPPYFASKCFSELLFLDKNGVDQKDSSTTLEVINAQYESTRSQANIDRALDGRTSSFFCVTWNEARDGAAAVFDLGRKVSISSYGLGGGDRSSLDEWTLYGSNTAQDGDWKKLDSKTGQAPTDRNTINYFELD